MTAALLAAAAVAAYLYAAGEYARRFPRRRLGKLRIGCFAAGAALMAAALSPPVDALADRWFTAHMFQHLVLTLVGPPLLLLGAPLLLCVALVPHRMMRKVAPALRSRAARAASSPFAAWVAFVATLWIAHFSGLYEAALAHAWIHAFEHGLFVVTALLFWMTVVQVGYAPRPLAFPVRLFLLFFAIPPGAFLGLAIYASHRVLYPHYAAGRSFSQALLDQRGGGEAMWIGGGLALFIAFLVTAAVWASHERDEAFA